MAYLSWHIVPNVKNIKYHPQYEEIEIVFEDFSISMSNPLLKINNFGGNPFVILSKLRQAVDEAFADLLNKLEED